MPSYTLRMSNKVHKVIKIKCANAEITIKDYINYLILKDNKELTLEDLQEEEKENA
jgi:hypothetical protein